MASESGCKQTHCGFIFVLAALALVLWLIVRFTGQNRAGATDQT